MTKIKKVKAKLTVSPTSREWTAAAEDGSGLKASGTKPKHARSKLMGLLLNKYAGYDVQLDDYTVYPAELERSIKELKEATRQAEQLLAKIPMLRWKVARALSDLNIDQTTIASACDLTQSYVATFLQLDPEDVEKMTAVIGRRAKE